MTDEVVTPPNRRRAERSDAALNRRRILEVAADVFASRDPRTVTMGDIARAAGVGRATLYRRYASTGEVAAALLDEHESRLQEQVISGPPPLGPGAAPAARLAAFYEAMLQLLEVHGSLVLGSEVGRRRFETGAYGFWMAHVTVLLREAGLPATAPLAHALLAPLAPDLYLFQRDHGVDLIALRSSLRTLSELLDGPASQPLSRPSDR